MRYDFVYYLNAFVYDAPSASAVWHVIAFEFNIMILVRFLFPDERSVVGPQFYEW